MSAQAPNDETALSFATWLPRDADGARMRNALKIAAMPYQRMSRTGVTETRKEGLKLPALKVLVAEDNTTNQKVIAKILERAGHEHVMVGDGQAALQAMLDPGLGPFDLVLMDVNMPLMNGIEATERYCASLPTDKRIPVIALTADATPEGRLACRAAGMAACATKPILPQHLFSVIADVLDAERGVARDCISIAQEPSGLPDAMASMAADPLTEAPDAPGDADTDNESPPVIDPETFSRLGQLGGDSFRREVAESFLADAKDIIAELEQAVSTRDAETVRDLLHAMRSSAANVGAVRIFELCLNLRDIDEAALACEGMAHLASLRRRYDEAHDALTALARAA